MSSIIKPESAPRRLIPINDLFEALHCSRSTGYALCKRHGVEIIKVGSKSLIPVTEFVRVIAELPRGVGKCNAVRGGVMSWLKAGEAA